MNSQDVKEYIDRLRTIENEISLLKDDKKTLDDEFEEKIDLKAVKSAIRITKILEKGDEDNISIVLKILGADSAV